ncbi:MAG: oligosaccharide flippase family protein [Bacteroidales bacterium]|nr:oligosaccharide flippase family protein [Bacteroidales bacterium]
MKTITRKLVQEKNLQSLATSVFVAGINLATFLLLVRSLGKEAFGEWVIFVTASTLIDLVRYGLTKRAIIHYSSVTATQHMKTFQGSGFAIDLVLAGISSAFIYLLYLVLESKLGIYTLFFKYYPLLSVIAVFWNNATANQNAIQRFDRILWTRILINIPFFILVLLNLRWQFGVERVIILFILSNIPASIISVILKWNGWSYLKVSNKVTIKKIINYGKYTLLTSTGSSLLRSSDTLIIGLSPILGATGVAIYSIPFKVVDLIQIPLNAFLATASPKMSKSFLTQNIEGFKNTLMTYTGAVSMLFLPVIAAAVIFSQHILLFLAGEDYLADMPLMTAILMMILLYGLILPFDRFTGVALDSAEMPDKNALKVYIMLGLNLIGNLLAVFIFQSLVMVAAVSVVFTITGMIYGWIFLNRLLNLNPIHIFTEGFIFYRRLALSVRSKLQ